MADRTWNGAGDGTTYEQNANWGGFPFPQNSADRAIFPPTGGFNVVTAGAVTVGEMIFQAGSNIHLTLNGNLGCNLGGGHNGNLTMAATGELTPTTFAVILHGTFTQTGGIFGSNTDYTFNVEGNISISGASVFNASSGPSWFTCAGATIFIENTVTFNANGGPFLIDGGIVQTLDAEGITFSIIRPRLTTILRITKDINIAAGGSLSPELGSIIRLDTGIVIHML